MRYVSNERRTKEKRGTGHGAEYIPWIKTREVSSMGTRSKEIDYKTGRTVHLLSQIELYFWHLLRWDDRVVDIREQYPLDPDITRSIAEEMQIMHPNGRAGVMTIDFLVDYEDGSQRAFSVKPGRYVLDDPRTTEKLFLEKTCCETEGIEYIMLWGEDLDMQCVRNVMDVVHVYNAADIADDIGIVKHLIAKKIIAVDMTKRIDYPALVRAYENTKEFKWVKEILKNRESSLTLQVGF